MKQQCSADRQPRCQNKPQENQSPHDEICKALVFAKTKHAKQVRKGTNTPYIVHPLGAMELLMKHNASFDAIIAGLLHDTLEDTDTSYQELVHNFGPRIAEIVKKCSEDKSLPWEARKQKTFDKIATSDDIDFLMVTCADKIDNLASIAYDYSEMGDKLWTRFNRGKEKQLWCYGGLANAFAHLANGKNIFSEYIKLFQDIAPTVFGAPCPIISPRPAIQQMAQKTKYCSGR